MATTTLGQFYTKAGIGSGNQVGTAQLGGSQQPKTSSGNTFSSGGGQAAPINSQPQGSMNNGAPQIPQPGQSNIDFDALIRPAIEGLDAAIAPLQGSFDTTVAGINSSKQTQTDQTNQSISAQTGTINQAKNTQKQYETSAADEARRQYSEIQQGLQSRYGGTTGTGAFAGELAGSQTLRSIADIRGKAASAQQGLDEKLQQVQEIGRISLQDIERNAQDQIGKAKNQLDLSLADIRNQKGQLLARKAELAANAIQMYQQTVNQVNTTNAQFQQQLYAQQQQAEQTLKAAQERAGNIAGASTPQELLSYVQSLQPLINAGFTPTVNTKIAGGGSLSLTPKASNDTTDILSQLGLQ